MADIDLKLDNSTNDLQILNGDIVLVSEQEELRQRLLIKLRWFYNEYAFNTTVGVRYFEDILVKNPGFPQIETLFRTTILETEGVSKLVLFRFSYDQTIRKASIDFEVESIYGTISEENIELGA